MSTCLAVVVYVYEPSPVLPFLKGALVSFVRHDLCVDSARDRRETVPIERADEHSMAGTRQARTALELIPEVISCE